MGDIQIEGTLLVEYPDRYSGGFASDALGPILADAFDGEYLPAVRTFRGTTLITTIEDASDGTIEVSLSQEDARGWVEDPLIKIVNELQSHEFLSLDDLHMELDAPDSADREDFVWVEGALWSKVGDFPPRRLTAATETSDRVLEGPTSAIITIGEKYGLSARDIHLLRAGQEITRAVESGVVTADYIMDSVLGGAQSASIRSGRP